MTDEEYLRNRLDRLNQNSHYGIMVDTEITKIVRSHIKRLEENKMNATSVQTIENVKEMHLTIKRSSMDKITKVIVGASTNDDIFEFHFSGDGCVVFADQWFNAMTEKAYKVDFESERNKRQMMETENSILRKHLKDVEDRLETANKQLIQENKDLKKRYDRLNKKFNRVMNDNLPETPITDSMLVDDYNRLVDENEKLKEAFDKECEKIIFEKMMLKEENKQLKEEISRCNKVNEDLGSNAIELEKRMQMYKQSQTQKIKELKKKLSLEKAANEAQHKFVREYAGKDTEIQFNYAIDDAKEVSYAIVEKNGELAEENKKLKQENENLKKHTTAKALEYIEINHKLQDENEELKYQLMDIQATKEVVEQKLNTREGILDQAKKCVCGQREQDYGTPESNFQLIADLWTDYLYPTLGYPKKDAYGIKAEDVAMMMALMKIARIRNGGGSGDSFVDLAGYAACGGEIWHGQKVKDQN